MERFRAEHSSKNHTIALSFRVSNNLFPDEERFRAEHSSKNHTLALPFRVRFR
jgi:hypothetical protein